MDYVTGADVLAQVGASTNPSEFETDWAALVASAVNDGIDMRIGGTPLTGTPPPELVTAARRRPPRPTTARGLVWVMAYADLQGQAYRIARDYLEGVKPID